ncbi:putative acetyltransferase EpsM [compost metagenome]
MSEYGFVIAIGNPYGHIRIQLHEYLVAKGLSPVSFADASAIIDTDVRVEEGAQIMRGSYVNTKSRIGRQCILNTKSLVEHHCLLEDGVEIGPSATLCGRVSVGQNTWIGAGTTVLPYLKIDKNVIVGAGSVVTKSILQPESVFYGNPAQFQRSNQIISSK